jgi:hypothetical protein
MEIYSFADKTRNVRKMAQAGGNHEAFGQPGLPPGGRLEIKMELALRPTMRVMVRVESLS